MLSSTSITASPATSPIINKGNYMETPRIDKIDVKKDHKELITLFYRLELISFVQALLYSENSIKEE